MTKTLTYLGAESGSSDSYRVPGDPDLVFPVGQKVEEVPDALARDLQKLSGQRFTTDSIDTEVAPWPDYDELSADEVKARIDEPRQTPTAGFCDRLVAYEKAHEKRKAVLEAATHQAEAYDPGRVK